MNDWILAEDVVTCGDHHLIESSRRIFGLDHLSLEDVFIAGMKEESAYLFLGIVSLAQASAFP